jgi:elongation factor Ts
MKPLAVSVDKLDAQRVAKEREILTEQARSTGKPENILGKIVEGRMRNFFAEVVLEEQPFVKDDKKTVGQVLKEAGVRIAQFRRWELGEGAACGQ